MTDGSPLQLSRLREIGWQHWDPIELRQSLPDTWQSDFADEYDGYLLHIAAMLRAGGDIAEAVVYLDDIVSNQMGLGPTVEAQHRASIRTVDAVAAYLAELDAGC